MIYGPSTSRTGKLVASTFASTNTSASTTVQIPFDDSIPQNTEGAELLTVTHNRQGSSNNLLIIFNAWGTHSSNVILKNTFALFQDSTAGSLAATPTSNVLANYQWNVALMHKMTTGSTGNTTFKIRFGTSSGLGVTTYALRITTGDKFSTATFASIHVLETE